MQALFDVKNTLMTLVGIGNLLLSFYIFFRNRRDEINRIFALVTVAIAIWTVAAIIFRASPGYLNDVTARLLYAAATLMPTIFLYFTAIFPPYRIAKRALILSLPVLNIAMILFVWYTSLVIENVRLDQIDGKIILFGSGYLIYSLYYLLLFGFSYLFLFKKYWTTSGIDKIRLRFLLLGTMVTTIVGLATNLLLPWYGIYTYYIWVGQISTLILVIMIAYAIVKHRLLNIKIITSEIFAILLLLTLLARLLLSSATADWLINSFVFGGVLVFNILLIRSVIREDDYSERISALATDLAAANEELKKLDEAKSEFISIAGHQLRTPLTVIKGYTSMLMEGSFGQMPAKAGEALNRVLTSAGALAKLVTDLLDLSRIEAGKIRYDFKEIKLGDIIHGVLGELENTAREKGVTFAFKNDGGSASVMADFEKMHEVVINLIDNAVKYSGTGTSINIELRAADDKKLLLSVADHGMGIEARDIPKLFAKFARSEEAKKVRPDGMGLGLYLVKKIVEDHKGRVWAESPGLEKGSTFYVELPLP